MSNTMYNYIYILLLTMGHNYIKFYSPGITSNVLFSCTDRIPLISSISYDQVYIMGSTMLSQSLHVPKSRE